MSSAEDLSARIAADLETLDREIAEIDLLVTQARTEAERHEQRRSVAAERLPGLPAPEQGEAAQQLVALTRRAALMSAQVEVLEGKRKTMGRFRDALAGYATAGSAGGTAGGEAGTAASATSGATGDRRELPPELAGMVLAAQEDLRREIARAMHDGPAQSLTNIVLQAQIVERILGRDADQAQEEARLLISMVEQTLEATKSFIFDVRPMVLDDLGLVPTLRRAARDRGKRAGAPVSFESMGTDRRLPEDLESGLFRIIDLALIAFLAQAPDEVAIRLDWGDRLEASVRATGGGPPAEPEVAEEPAPDPAADVPPALAALMEERRAADRAAAEAALLASAVTLPDVTWHEIQGRATTVGIVAERAEGGRELRLAVDLPSAG